MPLQPPLFELGLKGYLYGRRALELARAADRISREHGVPIIFDPQHVDIPAVAQATTELLVFAQHMDPVEPGRGAGWVLAEALKEAGAHGTLLNHVEHRLTLSDIARSIHRADAVGLLTLVCADSPEEAAAIAALEPNMILAEPPDLIGTGRSVARENREFITRSRELVRRVNPEIIVFNSAGIRTPEDVADVIRAGADATGTTSGVVKADDPARQLEEMVKALKGAWRETHS
ncbi:triosephosphate isomerase [bacterium]|nr:triosephosphate isomerase [bacterium]